MHTLLQMVSAPSKNDTKMTCNSFNSPPLRRCTRSWPLPSWRSLQSSVGARCCHCSNHSARHQSMSAHFLCWPCQGYGHGLHLMLCGAALSPPPPMDNPFSCTMTGASLFQDCVHCSALEICSEGRLRWTECKAVLV